MLPNDGRLQTKAIQNSVYTKICIRSTLKMMTPDAAFAASLTA
jgi:hypothetical protein